MKIEISSKELLAYIKEKYGLDEIKCAKLRVDLDIYAAKREYRSGSDDVWRHIEIERDNGDFCEVVFFIEGEKQ